jgi:long-chain fatty acid transport protein
MLYTPLRNEEGKPLVNIALLYRSQATLHLTGQFLVNGALASDARSTLVLPQVFTGGIAVWPVRNRDREWKLELDVDYVGWKSFRNLDVSLSTGGTLPFPQDWRNNLVVMIGTEYRWLRMDSLPDWELALRAGYWHSQTPVPDRTFSPAVPDADNHAIATGLGLMCKDNGSFLGIVHCSGWGIGGMRTKGMGLDLSYQAVLYEARTVSGNRNPTVDGLYQTVLHAGAVNFRLNF